ncbi:MAG: RnfABCDGE type electron transport complex subunit D [Cyanobacteria bacterium P01_G01_bin.38]
MFKDARDHQIVFLSLFLTLGVAMRDWSLRPEIVVVAIGVSLVTQAGLSWIKEKREKDKGDGESIAQPLLPVTHYPLPEPRSEIQNPKLSFNWRSPLITALGLSLLLRTDHLGTMALAASLAIASKFLLRVNDKHCFNPANFGIIAALTLTPDAWISTGQWGEEMWYALIFLGAGGIVLKRVGRWDTTGMFLGGYALLEALRNVYLGWTWDVWMHRMSSGSLLLFALFMVTDPRSIPNGRPARLMWAGAIATLTFILRNQFYLSTAVFWALFALAPLTLVLDKIWTAPRFEWKKIFAFEANVLPQA